MASPPRVGFLLAPNNLSDVADTAMAWANLGGGAVGQIANVGAGLTVADGTLSANMLTVAGRVGDVVLTHADIGGLGELAVLDIGPGLIQEDGALAATVFSVAGKVGVITLAPADVIGLGNSATRNVGTTGSNVAAGNDSRIVNAVQTSALGAANGVATLDVGQKLTMSQLPGGLTGGLTYRGTWDAATNTPTLVSSVGAEGDQWKVSAAGNTDLNGVTTWGVGDAAIFSGTVWQRVPYSSDLGTMAMQDADDVTVVLITVTGRIDLHDDSFQQADDRIPNVAHSWTNDAGGIVLYMDESGVLSLRQMRADQIGINVRNAVDTFAAMDDRIPNGAFAFLTAAGDVSAYLDDQNSWIVLRNIIGLDRYEVADDRIPGIGWAITGKDGAVIVLITPAGDFRVQALETASLLIGLDLSSPLDERLGDQGYALEDEAGNVVVLVDPEGNLKAQSVGVRGDTWEEFDSRVGDYPYSVIGTADETIALVDSAGVHKFQEVQTKKALLTGPIESPTQAVTKQWVEDLITDPISDLLRPESYGAVGNGVANDSVPVNECMDAARALGQRMFAADNIYRVPELSRVAGDLIPIGTGQFLESPIRKFPIPAWAPPPRMPWITLRARAHCPRFTAAASLGAATIVVVSDSVGTPQVTGMSFMANFNAKLKEHFLRDNPNVNIIWLNRGIGGKNWQLLMGNAVLGIQPEWYLDPSRLWMQYVKDLQPDLIIASFGRNGASAFLIKHIRDVIAEISTWAKVPDLVGTNSCGETQTESTDAVTPAYQRNSYEYAAAGIRSFFIANGLGFYDTETLFSQLNLGYAQEFLPLLRNGDIIGGMSQSNFNVPLPWTAAIPVYGYGGNFRVDPGDWTTMANGFSFQIGSDLASGSRGCRFWLRRDPGTFEISWRITTTLLSEGGAEDYIFRDWTNTGVTCNESQFFSFTFNQQGSRVYCGFLTPGNSPAEPVEIANNATALFHGYVPRCGGLYSPTITCNAGTVTGALTWTAFSDGWSGTLVQLPTAETLCMPQLTDFEYAAPEVAPGEQLAPWGGGGPHPGALAAERMIEQAIQLNDASAVA